MSCCDDPTEISKVDPRELVREQQHYGNLVRDLFTDDPEKVLLKLLNESNAYLRELAALRAHYPSVRLRAIELLDKKSQAVLEQLIEQEPDSSFGIAAKQRIEQLSNETGLFGKLFKS
ncbi:hypothetical protein [Methylotuvimicrobium buryatense]|uniref:HEAT repeat domain-containing protein n=1 Tax=Methylotuvimicrobium buryatense TaxID=95641 RepID=A0A4P9USH8_METBY|nr:hypothetical protein [Methylotuvimicrobium buryatense]QCW84397.1 hypothetical protein EQU24_20790 [Methylotuvimicrobium buryatense]